MEKSLTEVVVKPIKSPHDIPSIEKDLLEKWYLDLQKYSIKHETTERLCKTKEQLLSVPLLIISSSLGVSAFLSNNEIVTGVLSISIAILTGLHKYFGYQTTAEKHKQLAGRCINLSNDLLYKISVSKENIPSADYLLELKNKLDGIIRESPSGLD